MEEVCNSEFIEPNTIYGHCSGISLLPGILKPKQMCLHVVLKDINISPLHNNELILKWECSLQKNFKEVISIELRLFWQMQHNFYFDDIIFTGLHNFWLFTKFNEIICFLYWRSTNKGTMWSIIQTIRKFCHFKWTSTFSSGNFNRP